MVLTAHSKPHAREKIPAVIHADGTGRIQIVRAEDDPLTYAYLEGARPPYRRRAVFTIIFNVAGPIAQTPQQAIDTLRRSRGLDAVMLVADDGTVHAAWHCGERDMGRFRDWSRKNTQKNPTPSLRDNLLRRSDRRALPQPPCVRPVLNRPT